MVTHIIRFRRPKMTLDQAKAISITSLLGGGIKFRGSPASVVLPDTVSTIAAMIGTDTTPFSMARRADRRFEMRTAARSAYRPNS